jgi:hypothetical protein
MPSESSDGNVVSVIGAGRPLAGTVTKTVCAVLVLMVGNWIAPESQQLSQQFWCHLECFKRSLADHPYVEIEEMTPGDQA